MQGNKGRRPARKPARQTPNSIITSHSLLPMKHSGLTSPPGRAPATLTLALACYAATIPVFAQVVPVAEDKVMR